MEPGGYHGPGFGPGDGHAAQLLCFAAIGFEGVDLAEPGADLLHLGYRDGIDKDGVISLWFEQPVESVDGQIGVEYPESGTAEKAAERGQAGWGELLDDGHVVDGAAHFAAAIMQAEIAGGRVAIKHQGLAHIDTGPLAHHH